MMLKTTTFLCLKGIYLHPDKSLLLISPLVKNTKWTNVQELFHRKSKVNIRPFINMKWIKASGNWKSVVYITCDRKHDHSFSHQLSFVNITKLTKTSIIHFIKISEGLLSICTHFNWEAIWQLALLLYSHIHV